ncbi:MAG: peptidase [Pseudomonadota bacterium]
MTYCVGIKVNQGIVMVSDSRTSAGVDNISAYSKMWRYGVPGERQFVLCSAGNLATTQSAVAMMERDLREQAEVNLLTVPDLNSAAEYIGKINVESQQQTTGGGVLFETTFLFAGEINGAPSNLYMIYSQGNFIKCSAQVPFLQIGETKYGKPILDRVIEPETDLERAALCALVSMDAPIRSNLTVGPPVEICLLDSGSLQPGRYLRFDEEDSYLSELRHSWNVLMQESFDKLQPLNFPS